MITVEELKKVIDESLQDADCLIKYSEEIINSYTEAVEAINTKEEEAEKLKTKNDELRDECRKWISRAGITSQYQPDEKEEPTYEELTRKLVERMKGN